MLKFLLVAATLGSMLGAGGGTLASNIYKPKSKKKAPVLIALGKPGAKNTLTVPGVALAAGDTLQRPFDLAHTSTTRISAVALTTTASPAGTLTSDTVNGLQVQIDRCPQRWKQVKGFRRYTCAKRVLGVVRARPVLGTNIRLVNLGNILPKKRTAYLLLTLRLPVTAPNTLQGKASSLRYVFTAAQAAKQKP